MCSSNMRMNSSPIALRFSSGSVTPARRSKKRSAASTWISSRPMLRRNVSVTSSLSPRRIRPVSTYTHVSRWPIARWTSAAATAESTPPDSAQIARPSPTCAADALHLLVDDRRHRPRRRASGPLAQEAAQHAHAVRRVDDLGMELHAVDPPRVVLERGHRGVGGRCGGDEPGRRRRDRDAVAHPHVVVSGASSGNSPEAPWRRSAVRPYSPRAPRSTLPPSCRARSWAP